MKVCKILVTFITLTILSINHQVLSAGAFESGNYRNLFTELGIEQDQAAVTNAMQAAYDFYFNTGDYNTERLYYNASAPGQPKQAYIRTADSLDQSGNIRPDIRSEGMSYGMMITVQMDDQDKFDALWRFTKNHMLNMSGPYEGYFAWQVKAPPLDAVSQATHTNWWEKLDEAPAPDGEEYFAMSLMFAAHRWGNDGDFHYFNEAKSILDDALNRNVRFNSALGVNVGPLVDARAKQWVFTPNGTAFTDPSYHLPAFYKLWAMWDTANSARWNEMITISRDFLHRADDPVTGLFSEYTEFNGTPKTTSFNERSHIAAFDQMRTIHNVAFDWAWFEEDNRAVELANRVLGFYNYKKNDESAHPSGYGSVYRLGGGDYVNLNGDNETRRHRMQAHVAMNAVAALAADTSRAYVKPFVEDLWNQNKPVNLPNGKYRYYNGMLHMLGMLHVSGTFKVYEPNQNNGSDNNNGNGSTTTPTDNNSPQSGSHYAIKTGPISCIDLGGEITSNGANVVSKTCNYHLQQHWTFISVENGFHQIRNRQSQKSLDNGGSNIQQYQYWAGANQKFKVVSLSNGKLQLKPSQHQGLNQCLDLASDNVNGGNIQISSCSNTDLNQQFELIQMD